MRKDLQRGEGNLDAILIIAFLVFVMLVTPRDSNPISSGGFFSGPTTSSSDTSISSIKTPEKGTYLSVSSGNAAYSYQPYEEYITIENWGETSVDITGFQLKNGKDKRAYNLGGSLQRFSADIAIIPQASLVLRPSGGSLFQDVVLGRGERAVVTTGSVGSVSPYRITSFKENMCTGYLERMDDYAFKPALDTSCPQPRKEPGLEGLDTECHLFIDSLSSCVTPKFDRLDKDKEPCDTCINGTRISSSCAAFIKQHFNYQGCLAYHQGDTDFSNKRTWRIFLGRSWEMWAKNYESIELFDKFGNLVSSVNY